MDDEMSNSDDDAALLTRSKGSGSWKKWTPRAVIRVCFKLLSEGAHTAARWYSTI